MLCGNERRAPLPWVVFEIGILLLPDHRGRGLGGAAQALLADHLFSTTLANRLEAVTEVGNVAEQRSSEWARFLQEGTLRGRGLIRGGWRDALIYSRLRSYPRPSERRVFVEHALPADAFRAVNASGEKSARPQGS